jgi:hypothetical protein
MKNVYSIIHQLLSFLGTELAIRIILPLQHT